MKLEILSATVYVMPHGPDRVLLQTRLPCQYSIQVDPAQVNLELEFTCPRNTGFNYVKANFDVDIVKNEFNKDNQ